MKKTAFFWENSVYTNQFKCNKCGTKLADKTGKLKVKRVIISKQSAPFILCRHCGNPVIKAVEVDAEKVSGLYGNDYEKFRKEYNYVTQN